MKVSEQHSFICIVLFETHRARKIEYFKMINFGLNEARTAYRGCSKFIQILSACVGNDAARFGNWIIRVTGRKLNLTVNLRLLLVSFARDFVTFLSFKIARGLVADAIKLEREIIFLTIFCIV